MKSKLFVVAAIMVIVLAFVTLLGCKKRYVGDSTAKWNNVQRCYDIPCKTIVSSTGCDFFVNISKINDSGLYKTSIDVVPKGKWTSWQWITSATIFLILIKDNTVIDTITLTGMPGYTSKFSVEREFECQQKFDSLTVSWNIWFKT